MEQLQGSDGESLGNPKREFAVSMTGDDPTARLAKWVTAWSTARQVVVELGGVLSRRVVELINVIFISSRGGRPSDCDAGSNA